MNNKGFMMAEVVVVSSIILVTLTALYVSYNKIIAIYNQRVDYYDVTTLYELAYARDINIFTDQPSKTQILNEPDKKVYYLNYNDLSTLSVSNQTFKDYIEFLNNSATFETENILVMERCIDSDNCKYAYLEVFDSEETS